MILSFKGCPFANSAVIQAENVSAVPCVDSVLISLDYVQNGVSSSYKSKSFTISSVPCPPLIMTFFTPRFCRIAAA